ncbi:MAG: Ldh family oxidoreductase, partial [Pirellulaceae bacterium]|nr:Ldh family oxidoreductase [Pirellulaceae bacterium]
ATAEGKVRVKKIAGEQCPPGWLLDSKGRPTTDPETLYGDPPGSILPMGGEQAYKGFGLSLMIEILTGALSGGRTSREPLYPKKGNCVFMLLVDPEHFGGAAHFADEVKQLTEYVCSSPRVEGCEAIILPGDPERMTLAQRSPNGIFLDDENWAALAQLAADVGVAVPEAY